MLWYHASYIIPATIVFFDAFLPKVVSNNFDDQILSQWCCIPNAAQNPQQNSNGTCSANVLLVALHNIEPIEMSGLFPSKPKVIC